MNRLRCISLTSWLVLALTGGAATGQTGWVRPAARFYGYSPATAISAQVHAEADFLRAYGEAAADLSVAQEIRARAVRLEIDNSVEYVKAYWERRSINEAERLKRHRTAVQRRQVRNNHRWQQLKDHPELSVEAIPDGTALNFLLDRLAGGALAYQFTSDDDSEVHDGIAQLELPADIVHQLRVRQDRPGGEQLVFRLDEGRPLDIGWWPAALRGTELQTERARFEQARAAWTASSQKNSEELLKELFSAYDALTNAFHQHHTRARRLKSTNAHREYGLAKRFLQSLAGELYYLRSAGSKFADQDSLRFSGNNLLLLLTHMSRNGLEFAPALPGEEAAYHQVFHMLRDTYVAVNDDATSSTDQK
jgi:hypothetical protein